MIEFAFYGVGGRSDSNLFLNMLRYRVQITQGNPSRGNNASSIRMVLDSDRCLINLSTLFYLLLGNKI